MFKLFDMNMNEIPFPEGVKPLDIFVGSIAKNRQTEEIPGRNGVADYGTNYTDRSVELSMWIISSDTIDYRLLRNELYAFFDKGNAFYVAESNVPSRVLKVAVDDSYIPERLTQMHAQVDITCRTINSVFWESTYTTLELHDSGYTAGGGTAPSGLTSSNYQTLFGSTGNSQLLASDIQKLQRDLNILKRDVNRYEGEYGLVDGIDDEKVKYRFTENEFSVYNAGNVTVEPESMYLSIFASRVQSDGDFTIRNKTTNEEIVLHRESNGSHFRINGMSMSLGSINYIFRDTNRQFISLAPGDNEIEILNGTFEEIRFNFKFYYK